MANPLYAVPGLGGFLAQKQANEQSGIGQLQQAQALMGLQGLMQKQAQEQAYRADVSALGPNATPDALAQVVSKYNPEKGLEIRQRAVEQKEAREARAFQFAETLRMKEEALIQQRDAALQRATDKASQDAINNSFKEQSLVLQKQNQAFQQMVTQQGLDLKRILSEGQKGEKDRAEIERQIQKTQVAMKDIQPMLTAAHQMNEILSQYTPENVPGIGYAKNTELGKAFLSDEGKNVASSQKLLGSAILKAMSGAAVTPSEEIRQMAAQMADGRFSAKDFYIAWPKISKWISDQASLGTASLSGPARQTFIERTGINLDPIKPRFTFDGKQLKDSQAEKVIDFGSLK